MNLQFDGNQAFGYLEYLTTEIGSRLGGSENEKRAAEYIKKQFDSFGLTSWLEEFPITTFTQEKSKITAMGDPVFDIPHEIVGMSKDTPENGIEGELIYIENGIEEHITPEIKDKIVLVLGGTIPRDFRRYLELGAKAVITIENRLHELPMRIKFLPEIRDRFGAVPTFRIPYDYGFRLVKEKVKRLHIQMQSTEKKSISHNVIGELKGSEKPDEIIVVCGHYDTVLDIVGASDNGGGTVIIMELARIFAKYGSKRTLRFIAFGSEEMGLRGSVAYTEALKKADKKLQEDKNFDKEKDQSLLGKHRFCINIDVQGVLLGTDSCLVIGEPDVGASVKLLSKEIGKGMAVSDSIMSSDNTPLSSVDIPSIAFARSGAASSHLHTPKDDLTHLDPSALEKTGKFIELYMLRYIANSYAFPFERKVPQKLKDDIREYFDKQLRASWLDNPGNSDATKEDKN